MCLFKPKPPAMTKAPAALQAPPPPKPPVKVARKRPTYGGKDKGRLRGKARGDLRIASSPSGVNAARGSGGVYTPYA
jgi:hypothetical protein